MFGKSSRGTHGVLSGTHGVDVRVAQVVDDVREELDELAPKVGLFLVREHVDAWRHLCKCVCVCVCVCVCLCVYIYMFRAGGRQPQACAPSSLITK